MNLLILDPALGPRLGHNAAIVEEFAIEFSGWTGFQWRAAGAATLRSADFPNAGSCVQPAFQLPGYTPIEAVILDDARLDSIVASIVADLRRIPANCADVILMHTVYPLHLLALASMAGELAGRRVVCGMIIPPSLWTGDARTAARLSELMGAALGTLAARTRLLVYSETGTYRFGERTAEVATLLPPVSARRGEQMARLARRPCAGADSGPARFGFFGLPFPSKGVPVIAQAARRIAPQQAQVRFRVPPAYAQVCAQLDALGGAVQARCEDLDNDRYLEEMGAVDAVLVYYDPKDYANKMSGIVTEAICIGKPLVVAAGCSALITFLERYAPGSYVVGGYNPEDLAAIFALDRAHWRRLQAAAAASSGVMRELKSMSRYLAIAGVERPGAAQAAPRGPLDELQARIAAFAA